MVNENSTQYIGQLTEQKCFLKCLEAGYQVSKPIFDNARYDFILDTGERLLKIQIKTSAWNEDKTAFFVNVKAYDDNLIYASVRINSDSKIRLALYRVNADGYLEQGTLESTNWSVVSTAYVE